MKKNRLTNLLPSFKYSKKAVVTGAAGFIGSHVQDLLIRNKFKVIAVDNLSTGKKKNINKDSIFIDADIQDKETFQYILKRYPNVEYVFHLAALARIPQSIAYPLKTHMTNVVGSLNVLDYCIETKAKLIFSGSSSVYQGNELPTREDSLLEPKNPYTLNKLEIEKYIELYGQLYDMDYTILRYFNVFGERQITEGAYAAVVGIFLDQKARGLPLTITGDGHQKRDFTYVEDVARANLMAIKWDRDVYNIGTGRNYSINEIASMVGGKKKYIEARPGEVEATLADISKAKSKDWNPTTTIEYWLSQVKKR